MSKGGMVKVFVQSRKVPTGTFFFSHPRGPYSGVWPGTDRSMGVVFARTLDASQLKAIDEGRKLADQLGLGLEVIDESKSGFFRRTLSRFQRVETAPKLVITADFEPTLPRSVQVGPTRSC